MPTYPPPRILSGSLAGGDITTDGLYIIYGNIDKSEKSKEYVHEHRGDANDLALLLALISYCKAVDLFGLDELINSPLVPIILGKNNGLGTWVGTATDTIMRTINTTLDIAYQRPNNHILMRIKFFPWIRSSPEYLIAVR